MIMPNLVKLAQLEVVEKSGELNLVRRKKEERKKKIHFLAPKCPISNSHKIQTISNFGVR